VSRVSGTNAASDGNETNDAAPVSRVSGTNAASDGNETNDAAPVTENETAETQQPHEPHIHILKGQPTDRELAALIAVLGSVGGAPEPALPEQSRWGLPVDKLRYAISNYQRITLQQRIHMQR